MGELTTRPSVWARLVAAVRYVLQMEPVVVQGIVRALFVLAAAVGLGLSDALQARVLLAVAAFYALVETVTTAVARRRSTAEARVVEEVRDGLVLAGPASELPTGQVIREAGSLDVPPPLYPQA